MKTRVEHPPASHGAFAGDLHSRLEAVRGRVDSEMLHLDQVAAVAASYIVPMPLPLKLVR